jgi:hypothetical protein
METNNLNKLRSFGLITGKDGYKNYKKRFPKSKLKLAEYNHILNSYFEEVKEFLLEGGDYVLPYRLGIVKVIKVKQDLKKIKPDWEKTKQLWEEDEECKKNKKLVYHLNEHSYGHYYRVYWRKGIVKNSTALTFTPVRDFKRKLAKAIRYSKADYLKK